MTPHIARAEAMFEHVRRWAEPRDDVRALVVVGSFARGAARPDSDLDLLLLTNRPRTYLDDTTWVSTFGDLRSVALEPWGQVTSVRVHYDDRLEVEFSIASSDWASEPVDAGTVDVVRGGIVVLLDRDGNVTTLARAAMGGRR